VAGYTGCGGGGFDYLDTLKITVFMATVVNLLSTTDPGTDNMDTPAAQTTPASQAAPADHPCECETRAEMLYKRTVIIQMLTIVFYFVLIALILKMLFR
jgi:hypothetical protein